MPRALSSVACRLPAAERGHGMSFCIVTVRTLVAILLRSGLAFPQAFRESWSYLPAYQRKERFRNNWSERRT